jgi:hypothetical protein
MIQFDESEYLHSTVSDCTLVAVALLLGKQTADDLLYSGEKYVAINRLDTARSGPIHQTRSDNDNDTGPYDIWYPSDDQEPEDTAEDAKVRSLADTG